MLLKSHSIQCAIELFILTFHSYSRQPPPNHQLLLSFQSAPPPKKNKKIKNKNKQNKKTKRNETKRNETKQNKTKQNRGAFKSSTLYKGTFSVILSDLRGKCSNMPFMR